MSVLLRKQLALKAEEKKPIPSQPFVHRPVIVGNKGMSHSIAEILDDCQKLIPHAKKESRIPEEDFRSMGEIATDIHCDTVALFQTLHKTEPYIWLSAAKNGPSMCLFVEEGKSIYDLALVGNALKGSRPICIFDKSFEQSEIFQLAKILLARTFEVPNGDKHSKPFVDRTMSFFVEDGKIIVRHYQVQWEDEPVLVEIGPRITLIPAFVLAGCFCGPKIWKNATWESPRAVRLEENRSRAEEKQSLRMRRAKKEERRSKIEKPKDPHKGFFAPRNE